VTMGLLFYPRGGSAQVARYLAAALDRKGCPVRLFTGSFGDPGAVANAATFFAGLDVAAADYTPALGAFDRGGDPMAAEIPLHPSFEDRVGAPDRLFASLDDREAERQVAAWQRLFAEAGAAEAAIAHLHHLTPQHEALARGAPGLPVVAHLHGTELKMLDGIRRRRELAVRLGTDLTGMATGAGSERAEARLTDAERELFQSTRWEAWRYGDAWEARLQAAARRADQLIAISPHDRDEAARLLGVDASRAEVIPNGVDVERFDRQRLGPEERWARWRAWLVDDPRGWDASGVAGSVRYGADDLTVFADLKTGEVNPVLLYVGRFLAFKRVPLLVRAYQRARSSFDRPAPLVIWGGYPGEWEGEHPVEVARSGGTEGIFFTGWRGHDDLPEGLNAADVLVAPSVDEPFGQVYLEAMACGLPVIATPTGGPLSFVNISPGRPSGWFVDPDEEARLAATLIEVVNTARERRARGEAAYAQIRAGYAWDMIASRVISLYEGVLAKRTERDIRAKQVPTSSTETEGQSWPD
jgi:D-inositol-3-phosphate glycosyltransferase